MIRASGETSSPFGNFFLRRRSRALTAQCRAVAIELNDICHRGVGASAALGRRKGSGGFFLKIRMMVAIAVLELLDRHAKEPGGLPPIRA
jgi:hypothetical protein